MEYLAFDWGLKVEKLTYDYFQTMPCNRVLLRHSLSLKRQTIQIKNVGNFLNKLSLQTLPSMKYMFILKLFKTPTFFSPIFYLQN